jgi:glycerol-3-phosphate O-acyltransferase / dihydroxyacetone phosphate acyltransferase
MAGDPPGLAVTAGRVGHEAILGRRWGTAGAAASRSFYLLLWPIMSLAVALHFRRVRTLHRQRFPRSGPALVVANHPSTWTDVLLLDVVLRRGLHFLANEDQFQPWPRRALLHVYGALPVASLEQRPDAIERNEATFQRCVALFDRGDCVAMFPEGVSRVDRGLLPLKLGAARLACLYTASKGRQRPLVIVPVGIHYSDRTRFRSEVTVSVGEPTTATECEGTQFTDPEEAARRITHRLEESLSELVLDIRNRSDRRLMAALEPLASPRAVRSNSVPRNDCSDRSPTGGGATPRPSSGSSSVSMRSSGCVVPSAYPRRLFAGGPVGSAGMRSRPS